MVCTTDLGQYLITYTVYLAPLAVHVETRPTLPLDKAADIYTRRSTCRHRVVPGDLAGTILNWCL
jgi:hypothetical protein